MAVADTVNFYSCRLVQLHLQANCRRSVSCTAALIVDLLGSAAVVYILEKHVVCFSVVLCLCFSLLYGFVVIINHEAGTVQ